MSNEKLIASKITPIDQKDLTIGLITVLSADIVDSAQQSDVGTVKVDDEATLPWKEKGKKYPSLRLNMGYLSYDGSFQNTRMFCNQGSLTRKVTCEDGSKDVTGTNLGYLLDASGIKKFAWNEEIDDIKDVLKKAKQASKSKKEFAESQKPDVDFDSENLKSALDLAKEARHKPVKDEEIEIKNSDTIYTSVYAKDMLKVREFSKLITEKIINEELYFSVRFYLNDAEYITPDYSSLKLVKF